MQPKPAAVDALVQACLVLSRAALVLKQERAIDQFDMNAAVLHGFDGVGDLHQLARGDFGVDKGAGDDEFIQTMKF